MECGGADTALDWIATGRTRLPWPWSIQSGVSILLRQGFAGFRHAHSIRPSCGVCDVTVPGLVEQMPRMDMAGAKEYQGK